MPAPFQRLSIDEFAAVLQAFAFRRRVNAVHMHHTWRPNRSQWRGHETIVGMWRFHTEERGFSDIAQHLTIDPEGFVWTGRSWNQAPASAIGHNGSSVAGAFMFETIGDFDRGRDVLDGAQRQAVLDVITLVQARFKLPPESLAFHNQMATKSCPGDGIAYDAFLAEVRGHAVPAAKPRSAARNAARLALPETALARSALIARTVERLDLAGALPPGAPAATPAEELACDSTTEAVVPATPPGASRGGSSASAALTPDQIDALRPHVLNLRMGRFSSDGLMTSSPADVDMIVNEHVRRAADVAAANGKPLRVVLFAHGGLVKESTGLAIAQTQVDWWLANGVYPIHFVWETGLFETLRGLLERARSPLRERGLGDLITDRFTDPLLEAAVRALQGPRIWGAMKVSAQLASAEEGAARVLLRALAALIGSGARLELHAVGHSAGAIFHAHLLGAAQALGLPSFKSVQLLAPAIRADAFLALIEPLLGAGKGADALTVFTMRRDFERADDCARLYRKSLLYLVSAACEPETATPLLGLEDSLRGDARLAAVFGLGGAAGGRAEVVWSTSPLADGRSATRAVHHADFDNDAPTMNSVARRVLELDDAEPLPKPFPAAASRGAADPWNDGVDWPDSINAIAVATASPAAGPAPAHADGSGQAPAPAPTPTPPAAAVAAAASTPSPAPVRRPGSGRRLALCVGIDHYPANPLAGCCNDAKAWQTTLARLGFDTQLLLDPTRKVLFGEMQAFIGAARAGDELVFQYAGHGTHVKDVSGDEIDGSDEALCPLDFADGALLLDDDIGALIDQLDRAANITLFMDCCHSATNSRFGGPLPPAPRGDARQRYIPASPALNAANRAWRERNGSVASARSAQPEVLLTACRADQVAWERDGQGEFTLHATGLLALSPALASMRVLHQRVVAAFGPAARQNPTLAGPAERLDAPIFGR